MKISSSSFSTLIPVFSTRTSIVIFHWFVAFQRYEIYQILFNIQIVKMARKISAMYKKLYFSYNQSSDVSNFIGSDQKVAP